MYRTAGRQDVVTSELGHRLGRKHDDIAGPRRRRSITRRGSGVGDMTFPTAVGAAVLLTGR